MGMYSHFSDEDIDVTDKEGLKLFLKDWGKVNPDWWLNKKMIEGFESKEGFSFGYWTDMKLISYWYSLDVAFLNCVAKYIEGGVSWEFENQDESANVRFESGECIIECGIMEYTDFTSKEMIDMDVINKKTKRLMICSNL